MQVVQTVNPAQPTPVLLHPAKVLLSDAELNQGGLVKKGFNLRWILLFSFIYSRHIQPCSNESSVSIMLYHAIKLKVLNI